ncbi:hypothetical protein TWF102_009142 [Orbilia oligospora]|uniref:Uncharacterized protein n=1 Tax=Orbilia oligospora TaxID=2813651 RepID=A0A7C8JHT7_ORBOL|nr:hypothetical protein TWF103_005922 [Orbilia oligospora]KAF3109876.1 hypothetical protein TWF102_009142 [Orbilia oligospora]KAF3116954.1 hypothetical protein TWF706_000167 [Orbilia oligospora]
MSELVTVWKCLEQRYDVDVNEKCSTHIHFSLLDKDWEFDDLQSLAKAILMLDPLIKRLFPDRQYMKECRARAFSCTPPNGPAKTRISRTCPSTSQPPETTKAKWS